LVTREPYPRLPVDISTVFIVSAAIGADATSEDFNTGKAAIGTGPYRLIRWQHGDRLELVRHDGYWGRLPDFENVSIRFIPNDAARVAALLTATADIIDAVPPFDLERFRARRDLRVYSKATVTLIYLHLDSARAQTPFVTAHDGSVLAANPLRDSRVRHALSLAIDRDLLIDKILMGAGVPAAQIAPAGLRGFSPAVAAPAHDPAKARALLAAAGYPQGFRITLHATNNRYLNDALVAQALAIMLSKVGVATAVEAMPRNVFLPRATNRAFSVMLYGYGSVTGDALMALKGVLGTPDAALGRGANNRGGYSNAALDALIAAAEMTAEEDESEALTMQAAALAAADMGIIPLYHQTANWASTASVTFLPRADERTLAYMVRRVQPAENAP
ncbi:MAG: ABC transporter substrate-binding protein, partial [Alphaproteobacteria bacterium]